jgi:hypothetical protein
MLITPVTGLEWPRRFQKVKVPRFRETAQDGGRLLALRTGHIYPQQITLVINFRGCFEPRAVGRSEGFYVNGGGMFVSLTHRPPLTPRKYSWYSFLLEAESTPGP